jgi:hypothetical protein
MQEPGDGGASGGCPDERRAEILGHGSARALGLTCGSPRQPIVAPRGRGVTGSVEPRVPPPCLSHGRAQRGDRP